MINYLWIGPPASRAFGVICGQDTLGPKLYTGETCNFWCLAEHAAHYSEVFKDDDNVTVMPIQPFLAELAVSDDEIIADYARRTQVFFDTLLSDDRNRVRDRVTAKVLFCFLLLYTRGGYVADSNILFNDPAKLTEREGLAIPCFNPSAGLRLSNVDFWMLYSPPLFERSRLTLHQYLDALGRLEARFTTRTAEENNTYPAKLAYTLETIFSLFVQPTLGSAPMSEGVELLAVRGKGEFCTRYIDTLGVEKHLFNTHKHDARLDQLFLYIDRLNIPVLTHLLRSGEDINQTTDIDPYSHLSLLHYAVWQKKPESIRFLLDMGIDLTRQATRVKDGETQRFTALEFAQLYYDARMSKGAADADDYKHCLELLKAHTADVGLAGDRLRLMPAPVKETDEGGEAASAMESKTPSC